MGISGVSIGSLLIVLVIVMLLFGTKRLRTIGGDLGGALRGFRQAISETDQVAKSVEFDAGLDHKEAQSALGPKFESNA